MRRGYPELEKMPAATLDMKVDDKVVFEARPVGADRHYAVELRETGLVARYPDDGSTDKTFVFKNVLARTNLNPQTMNNYVRAPATLHSQ